MNYKFFYTAHCPRCPRVKTYLQEHVEMESEWIAADTDEGLQKARKYEVMMVPTVIFFDDEREIGRAENLSELENYVKNRVTT